jgi:hypothetical protein
MYLGLDADRGRSQRLTRPFLGLQAVWLCAVLGLEYRWPDSALDAKPVFSAAIRQMLSDGLAAELGTTNASPVGTGLGAQRLFLRLSHAFQTSSRSIMKICCRAGIPMPVPRPEGRDGGG